MYKIAAFTDLHLKDNESIGGIDELGRNLRTVDKVNYLNEVVKFAIDNHVDALFDLGDTFNDNSPSNRLRNIVSKIMLKALKNNIKVYILGGNHDTNDNVSFNMMSESNYNENLIFAKNTTINTNEGIQLKLISWGQDDCIEKMNTITPTILFGHLQIEGAHYDNERLAKGFIKPSLLSKFKKVYLGHFHKRQRNDIYTYIGALSKNNFGERDNPDGFLYLTLNTGVITEEFISINDRKFYQFEKEIYSEDDIYAHLDSLNIKDNVLKIVYKIPNDLTIHKRKIKEYAKSKNPFDVLIEYERDNEKIAVAIEKNLGYKETFDKYNQLNTTPKKYIEVGEGIIKEVFK